MDILENAADRRPPLRRRTRTVLLVLLAGAVVAAIGLSGQTRRQQPVARPSLSAAPTPVVASLVETGSPTLYRSDNGTKEFVLSVDLTNFNRVPVRVAGGSVPEQPGFDRLVVAVLPAIPGGEVGIDEVAAAARTPVPMTGRGVAQLVIAGRVVCGAGSAPTAGFPILVDGASTAIEMPRFDGHGWAEEIIGGLCPAQ
ncbi:hypothetical protein ACWKSP_10515 [Micromonosporaceae bacterium Da 78-11]